MSKLRAVAAGLAALMLLAMVVPIAHAQTNPAIVSSTLAPDSGLTVGDRMTLTVVVAHSAGTTVEGPGFSADFGALDIIELPPPRLETADGGEETTLTYVLTSYTTGRVTLPPLELTYRGTDGDGALTTPPFAITVESILAPGDNELRPLKPQLEISESAPPPIVPATYVAIFAALTALGYLLVRRAIDARPLPAAPPPPPPLTPYEAARASLDTLGASTLAQDDPPAYYAAIAASVRRFLSARHDFPAYALTRRELQRDMLRAGIDRWPARLTANLLEQCDAVEFAGFRPAPERASADLTAAYEIIELVAHPPETPGA